MANLGFQFKSEEVPISEFEPIPAGEYVCMFTESELKDNAAKTGQYIQMSLEVVEGEYSGRKLIERLNIKNPNVKAVEMAFQTLAKICNAVNKPNIQDTEEVHNIRLVAKIDVQKSKDYTDRDGNLREGSMQNVIKKYKNIKEKSTTSTATADSSPTGGDAKRPWQK